MEKRPELESGQEGRLARPGFAHGGPKILKSKLFGSDLGLDVDRLVGLVE